jgi:hypothetical protein
MKIKAHGVLRVLMILVLVTLAVTLFSFVVRGLWNWLMPALFGLHVINFWQALGLLVLSKILVSGFHGRHSFGRNRQMRLIRRWEQMSPEEREAFRAGLRGGCGPAGASPVAPKA